MVDKSSEAKASKPQEQTTDAPTISWDTSGLKSSYANVCNVSSTREEVILNFGVNHAWERGSKKMEIELNNRIILSPFAAKRMSMMLSKLIEEYESRHGKLDFDVATQKAAAAATKQ